MAFIKRENGKHQIIELKFCDKLNLFFKRKFCDCFLSDKHKVFEEGEDRLEKEMDLLQYIKGMRTMRVLTSDKLVEMKDKVKISDINVIERGVLNAKQIWQNLANNIGKIELINDSSNS